MTVNGSRQPDCYVCGGQGYGHEPGPCRACNGTGRRELTATEATELMWDLATELRAQAELEDEERRLQDQGDLDEQTFRDGEDRCLMLD
jgi:DnaJ-class molecular chaperone